MDVNDNFYINNWAQNLDRVRFDRNRLGPKPLKYDDNFK